SYLTDRTRTVHDLFKKHADVSFNQTAHSDLEGALRLNLLRRNAPNATTIRLLKVTKTIGFFISVPTRLPWTIPRRRATQIRAWKNRQYPGITRRSITPARAI